MNVPMNKQLKFIQSILTQKERDWLRSSKNETAIHYRRLSFLLSESPDNEFIMGQIKTLLQSTMEYKLAYKKDK